MRTNTIIALLLVVLLAGVVEAQRPCPPGMICPAPTRGGWPSLISPVRSQQPRQVGNPAIVRVGCRYRATRRGQLMDVTDYGSGTIFARRDGVAYVVTCWHTFQDSGGKGSISVWAGGRQYGAIAVETDELWDVVALKIKDPGIKPLPLADAAPTRGQKIWIAGFGSGAYRHAAGQLTGFRAPGRNGSAFELMSVSTGAREGDSGGPMIGVRGRVVGVISTTNGRSTYGCCLPRLRRILQAVLPPYPNRPGIVLPKPRQVAPMEPKQQTPPVAPANTALLARVAELEKLVKALQEQVAASVAEKGPPGEQGPIGKDGPRGPPLDLDELVAKVLGKLPLVKLGLQYPHGKVVELAKPLGEVILLPPQRVEWLRLDGTILKQEKPLGEALRFESVEIDVRKAN